MHTVFEHQVSLRWRDVDALGHVNHAVFLTYLEEGRDAFYAQALGRDVADVLEYERASPTATEILAGLSPAQAAELTRQVRECFAAYLSADGVVMPGAAWLVTAQAV